MKAPQLSFVQDNILQFTHPAILSDSDILYPLLYIQQIDGMLVAHIVDFHEINSFVPTTTMIWSCQALPYQHTSVTPYNT